MLTDSFADEKGNVVPASHYRMNWDWLLEVLVTITFEKHQGRTKLSLQYELTPQNEMIDPMTAGWNESFDKLAEVLK